MSDYELTYSKTEDRLLVSGDEDQVVALTRRLTREMLKAIAKVVAAQKSETTNELTRNTVLNFEHSKAVVEAYADGRARREKGKSPNAALSKLAHAVDIIGKKRGGATLVFRDTEKLLTLALDSRGIYVLMSTLLEIAVSAGWDFPEIASWLAPLPSRERDQQPPKTIH
jgi:hypothetical protein